MEKDFDSNHLDKISKIREENAKIARRGQLQILSRLLSNETENPEITSKLNDFFLLKLHEILSDPYHPLRPLVDEIIQANQ
ncbi:MAG: hypothetical protein GY793_11310 [Proteobacteria bacterium]|nr:hypothetical protein [Pseudomonadota bacterium]